MKIAILDDYQGVARDLADWESLGAEITVFQDTIGGAALVERLEPFDVICLMRERTPFPAELIAALPSLRLIVTSGMRNLSIDIAAAAARGIPVCGTASRGAATTHHALSLILAGTRGLVAEALSMHSGGWQRGLGRDLEGLRLGLVGLGRLGAEVARLARPFGMEIAAWSANLTEARCEEVGATRCETLEELLETSDVVSIHLVLSDRSRGLIGAEALGRMKPDALLVNTSRGPIVDEAALVPALRAGRPGCAAIDVFSEEPLPTDHPLRDRALIEAGRLILTPHIGYVGRQTYETFYTGMVEVIAAWQNGDIIREITP